MTDKREEKRDYIVKRAKELFARYGLKKTTMDDIASKCDLSKATLYYYFESKEDIFKLVLESEFNIFRCKMEQVLSEAESPHDKLRTFILTRFVELKKLANYYSTLTSEYLEHYAFVEHERVKFTNWEIEMVRSILDEGVQQDLFDVSDSKLTALTLVCSLKGLEYRWTVESSQ